MRILFISDIHSSLSIWEKALDYCANHNVELLILSGDHDGKLFIPIVSTSEGCYAKLHEQSYSFNDINEVKQFRYDKSLYGIYSKEMEITEVEKLRNDSAYLENVFHDVILEHMTMLMNLLTSKILPPNLKIIVSLGNDDPYYLDDLINKYQTDQILIGINNCFYIDEYCVVNFEYTQPTPWETPRELSENIIEKKIDTLLMLNRSEYYLFNFHCPPYNTLIDCAPKIDKNFKPVIRGGELVNSHVGSKAIRRIIEKYQPICSLHGHVHESPGKFNINKTICFNPGSEYERGILRGYIIEIDKHTVVDSWIIVK